MSDSIATGSVHHVTLTVTNLSRARDFYTNVLGFQVALEYGPKILLTNGQMVQADLTFGGREALLDGPAPPTPPTPMPCAARASGERVVWAAPLRPPQPDQPALARCTR
jgi:catechol 2,3-dioxygenase-like lactoylglutathione lyase family enzyme